MKYAKNLKSNGNTHGDNLTQWDVESFENWEHTQFDGSWSVPPVKKAVVLNASKTDKQTVSVEINTKHDGSESKGNHRLLITNYSQENNNLGFRNKILQKERNISSDTTTHPLSTGWTISVHDIPVSKTTDLVNCSGPHER